MSLTPWQQEQRRKYLTASKVPAVMGCDPFRTAADVLAYYTLPVQDDRAGEAAEIGLGIEPMLIEWCAAEIGLREVVRNQWRVGPNGVNAATFDAVARKEQAVGIEAKTAGILNPAGVGDEWGEAGTDQIPMRHLLQVVGQLIAAPSVRRVYVPALIGGRGRVLYQVDRDTPDVAELIVVVEARCAAWWKTHVLERTPLPADEAPPSLDTLRRVRREPSSVIDLTNDAGASEAVAAWRDAQERRKLIEAQEEAAKARAVALLGSAEAARVRLDGETKLLRCVEQSFGKRVDTARLRSELPEVYAKYVSESRGVVPRLVKA
jgi:predicted phage-related endonuclease